MAKSKPVLTPTVAQADSALVERPQTWQAFQTCDCGRLWLWEQTATGKRQVSPVGLPHVCTTQRREKPTPSQGRSEEGVAALQTEP